MIGRRHFAGLLAGISALAVVLIVWKILPLSPTPENALVPGRPSPSGLPREGEGASGKLLPPIRMLPHRNQPRAREKAEEVAELPIELPEGWMRKIPAGTVVFLNVETDLAVYDLGEPVRVRRVFEYRGSRHVRIPGGHPLGSTIPVGIRGTRGTTSYTRSYAAYVSPLEARVLHPGERIEDESIVEIALPGRCTIVVADPFAWRDRDFRLHFEVVDRGDPALIAAKAERIGRRIAAESRPPPDCWTQAHEDLRDLGAKGVPHLRRFLREAESARLRAVSAKILLALKAREAVPDLIRGLEDENARVRIECLKALAGLRETSALDSMLRRFGDPDEGVRASASISMRVFEDERAISALCEAVGDPAYKVRFWAAVTLADKGDPAGIEVLIEALRREPGDAWIPIPRLEKITGLEFGRIDLGTPCSSDSKELEKAAARSRETAAKWLAWWEEMGRSQFGK